MGKKLERREIIKDKYKLLMKVYESEKYNDIVVMTKYDKDIEALIRKKGDIKYFIINDEMYDTLSQTGYEGECCKTIVKYLEDENNENRAYKGAGDISKVIRGKIERCVLNVITDKIDSENSIEIGNKNSSTTTKEADNLRKCIKILSDNYIYNI